MRHHIAGCSGVAVPVPGPAYFCCLVVDLKILNSSFKQAFAHTDASKAGADDQGVENRDAIFLGHILIVHQCGILCILYRWQCG